jgi:hypothetical protein
VLTEYQKKMWSDGLPIIPPTVERVKEFLKYTDYPADAILTRALPPSYREVTPWSVAVNGVMAGCRPEYMPVLIAMAKAWAEVGFQAQNSSSTPGWSPVVAISGPIKAQVGLNYHHNYGTPGFQSNTSLARFWSMFKRNLCEIRVEPPTDMGTHGVNVFLPLGENDEMCKQYGWKTLAEEQGFKYGDNVVTTMSCTCQQQAPAIGGSTGEEILSNICGQVCESQGAGWRLNSGWYMFVITELVGQVLAKDGFTKDTIRDYIVKNARLRAGWLEKNAGDSTVLPYGVGYYCKAVQAGTLPPEFCVSTDPNRLVPMFVEKKRLRFVLGGDEARNRVECFQNNGGQGALTSMKIELPAKWDALYAASQLKKDMDSMSPRQYKCL